jgi:hypothetical protein
VNCRKPQVASDCKDLDPRRDIMRRRLLIVAGIILTSALALVIALGLRERSRRLARCRFIDQAHSDQIQSGMTEDEVEAILGGPPGDFRTAPVWYPGTFMHGLVKRFWAANQGRIEVDFDENGSVVRARLIGAEHGPPRGAGIRGWVEKLQDACRTTVP